MYYRHQEIFNDPEDIEIFLNSLYRRGEKLVSYQEEQYYERKDPKLYYKVIVITKVK